MKRISDRVSMIVYNSMNVELISTCWAGDKMFLCERLVKFIPKIYDFTFFIFMTDILIWEIWDKFKDFIRCSWSTLIIAPIQFCPSLLKKKHPYLIFIRLSKTGFKFSSYFIWWNKIINDNWVILTIYDES